MTVNEILAILNENNINLFECDANSAEESLQESLKDDYFCIITWFMVHRIDKICWSVKRDAVSDFDKLLNDTADKYESLFPEFQCNRIDFYDSMKTNDPEKRDYCYIFQLVKR